MPILSLEITKELHEKIVADAQKNMVTPEHMATAILSCRFCEKETPAWLPAIPPFLRHLTSTIEHIIASEKQG